MLMLNVIAATSHGFFHTGNTSKLSFSDSEFIALNISTVTRIDRLIVVARRAIRFVNISHPISGKRVEHWWKCVWGGQPLDSQGRKQNQPKASLIGRTISAVRPSNKQTTTHTQTPSHTPHTHPRPDSGRIATYQPTVRGYSSAAIA
jgi:hypothetical protein